MAWIDTVTINEALDQAMTNDITEFRHSKPDLFALISIVCASSLILLPATYTICMGLIDKSADLGYLLDQMEANSFEALGDTMHTHPSLIGLQALAVYLINLSPR